MTQPTYTAEQVYDSLIRQGLDDQRARVLAMAVGSDRVNSEQLRRGYRKMDIKEVDMPSGDDGAMDSNIAPNLAEGLGFAGGAALADRYIPKKPNPGGFKGGARALGRGVGRLALPGAAGVAASLGAEALSGTNYYDRASDGQLMADIGGSVGGAIAGEKLGAAAGKKAKNKIAKEAANNALRKTAGSKVAGGIGSKLLGKAAAHGAGRAIGGTLGAVGGPIGSIALSTALGYLLPKVVGGGSKSVEEDEYGLYKEPF